MFYAHQYGFRTGHCTEYAALEIIDRVTTQLDIKDIPLNILIDLSKVFDSLDHAILLRRIMTGWAAYAKHRDIFESNHVASRS